MDLFLLRQHSKTSKFQLKLNDLSLNHVNGTDFDPLWCCGAAVSSTCPRVLVSHAQTTCTQGFTRTCKNMGVWKTWMNIHILYFKGWNYITPPYRNITEWVISLLLLNVKHSITIMIVNRDDDQSLLMQTGSSGTVLMKRNVPSLHTVPQHACLCVCAWNAVWADW